MTDNRIPLDMDFFTRLKRFEAYYAELAKKEKTYVQNYEVVREINAFLQVDNLGPSDIEAAITVYNTATSKGCPNGSGWLDVQLHLCCAASNFGMHYTSENGVLVRRKKLWFFVCLRNGIRRCCSIPRM